MATYAIYSFEIQEGQGRSLFYKETGERTINMAGTIFNNLLHDGMTFVAKKRRQDLPLKYLDKTGRDGIFTLVLCNEKDITQYEGHEKTTLESHPGCYVIFDNRPGVCQIAIEQSSAFGSGTEKVAKIIKRAFDTYLSEYGLQFVIRRKYKAGRIRDLVLERILEHKDALKKIVWRFPNPDRTAGIDADKELIGRMGMLDCLAQATHALTCNIEWKGSKKCPLHVDENTIEGFAQIIAASAQNGYDLSFHFWSSIVIDVKRSVFVSYDIDSKVISDFGYGQLCFDDDGQTAYQLQYVLDNIRKEVANCDETTIEYKG